VGREQLLLTWPAVWLSWGLRPRKIGSQQCLVGRTPHPQRKFLDGMGCGDLFGRSQTRKPDARIYQLALERLRAKPEEAVFVDDMPENVEAARALGMCGVQFQNTAQTIADVKRCLGE
jgi:FMN phosphatase YigB (HAD superfamily)